MGPIWVAWGNASIAPTFSQVSRVRSKNFPLRKCRGLRSVIFTFSHSIGGNSVARKANDPNKQAPPITAGDSHSAKASISRK